jgi:hypothetical protein
MSRDHLREFYDCLNREEAELAAQLASDRAGLVMRVAINELDLDFEGVFAADFGKETAQERAYLMRIAVNRVIKLSLQAHPDFEAPTLTFQRRPDLSMSVLVLLAKVSTIEHGRRIAQSLASRSGRIEKLPDRFKFTLPPQIADLELHERELDRLHGARERELFWNRYEAIVGGRIGDDVRLLLSKLVYPFMTHFIGYDSDPKLDVYFFGLAYNEITLSKGFDTFHFSDPFGGITFQNFKLAAAFIISAAMRHRAFARALREKDPSIRIEDILTVSVTTENFVEGMRDFINYFGEPMEGHVPVTDEDARAIFETLSISRRNLDLLDRPGAPIPPLVQCSDGHVIRPLAGATTDVMLFLLNSLQHSFRRDYDRAQMAREGAMQRALERTLRTAIPDLQFRPNIKLRRNGKVLTDLDLVVMDPSRNRVIIVQLKHQDPYGADLATMQSRTQRLDQQVGDWLVKVRSWLADAKPAELRATLGLPASIARPSMSLFVLTRHFAHSLRNVVNGDDVAFSNWTQLVSAIGRMRTNGGASLDDLMSEVSEFSRAEEEYYLPEPTSEWSVGGLRYTIEQEAG